MESLNKARPVLVSELDTLPSSFTVPGSVVPLEPLMSPHLRALLKRSDLQNVLRISGRTIDRLVAKGGLPRPIRVGQSYRWRVVDIEKFLAGTDQAQS
jgi:predicted DNA-binding transcriptional regulator AlpA